MKALLKKVEALIEETWKLRMWVTPVKRQDGLCLPVIFGLWCILAPVHATPLIFTNCVLISAFWGNGSSLIRITKVNLWIVLILSGREFFSHGKDPVKLCHVNQSLLPCCLNNKTYFIYRVCTDKPQNLDVPEGAICVGQALREGGKTCTRLRLKTYDRREQRAGHLSWKSCSNSLFQCAIFCLGDLFWGLFFYSSV